MPLQFMKLTKSTEVVMNACQLTDRPIARAATCGTFHNSRLPDKILGLGPHGVSCDRSTCPEGVTGNGTVMCEMIVICDEPAMGNTAIQGGRFMSITKIGARFKVRRHVKWPQSNRVTPSRDRGFFFCRLVGEGFTAEAE